MNLIEHVWDALGRRVAGRQPPPQTLQELERALLEKWDRIPQLVFNSLIDSMPQRKDLESQFYASQQNRAQDPTHFMNDQLKVHNKLGLGMPKEALVNHIFVRLEPQCHDYVEIKQGSRNSGNVERRRWNESRRSNYDDRQRNWRNSEVLHRLNNSRNNYRSNYESGRQRNQWFESRNEINKDDRRFEKGYQSGNRVQSKYFSRRDRRNRGPSTNFYRYETRTSVDT
ncbi:transposable element Tcb2 transposase [Trichonephila clavipes]|nr:transposable element Tcb2 transposase [Trichonephila clavipes]